MSDYDTEPVPGLPALLPAGETLLWQGAPQWRALARRAFHTYKVAIYCGVFLLWRAISGLSDGESVASVGMALLKLIPLALAAVAILSLIAFAFAKMTVYTITSKRLVIRSGVILPITLNIPFRMITGAGLNAHAGGTGDISVTLTDANKIAYLLLWPNARPWRVKRPEPTFRAVADAARVADIMARALAADAGTAKAVAAAAPALAENPSRSTMTAAAA